MKEEEVTKGQLIPLPRYLVVMAGRPWMCARFMCLYTGRYISPLASVLRCYFCSKVAEILFTAALPVPGISLALNKNFLSGLANVKIGDTCTL